jgi:hypothetical protein
VCPDPAAPTAVLENHSEVDMSVVDEKQEIGCAEGLTALALLAFPATGILGGYVVQRLWGWYIVGTFGLPGLTLGQAIGLDLLVSYLTFKINPKNDGHTLFGRLQLWVMGSLAFLYWGWLFQWLFM